MASGWLERRRLAKNEARFCELVRQNQYAAASAFYRQNLAGNAAGVGRPLRVLHHLCRWIQEPNDEDYLRLWDLASGSGKSSQVARARTIVERLVRQIRLAAIVSRRDGSSLDDQPGTPVDEPDTQSLALERLAAAVLECERFDASHPAAGNAWEIGLALRILGMLPAHDALPGPSRAHAHLLGWARLTAGQPELLCQNESELAAMTVEDRKAIRLAAGLLWGKLAVAQATWRARKKRCVSLRN